MPSQLHESHLLLFRNQPTLAADLIRTALGVKLPSYRDARVVSADLTITKQTQADDNPELAVLSAMAHGRHPDTRLAVEIAIHPAAHVAIRASRLAD